MKLLNVTLLVLPLLILTHSLSAGSIETPVELEKMSPPSRLGVSFEEAYLQEYDGNRHPYSYVSTLLSLDWEPWKPFVIWGQPIRWQWRASFVADSIMHGPETVYLGVAPQIRWIAPIGKTPFSLYFGGGAGAGWADASSKNTQDGGLGQPFTFILMASGGLRYDFNEHWSAWAGMAYQHLSNAKLSQPHKANLGLDSLGAMIGVGYGF